MTGGSVARVTRRRLLQGFALLPAGLSWLLPWPRSARGQGIAASPAAVSALVDAILPADPPPGAVAIGIDDSLLEHLRANRKMRELYAEALDALYQRSAAEDGHRFAALPLEQRVALVDTLRDIHSPPGHRGRMVHNHARRFVMERFYASPAGQAAVGYRPPAEGYPPPAQ